MNKEIEEMIRKLELKDLRLWLLKYYTLDSNDLAEILDTLDIYEEEREKGNYEL